MLKFTNLLINRTKRFLIEREMESGKMYVVFAVFNRLVEYDELYEISEDECKEFLNNETLLKSFVNECKEQKNDDRLLDKPGSLRGSPCE